MLRVAVALSDGAPPTEFRIFPAGKVETSKGVFVFDEKAAASVMAAYADQGNELMVDYDHASLSLALDPAQAGKAAGWFGLELRDGELWAVNVRWTEPAAAALARAEWRYFSPAFDHEDGRILELVNVALTNIPATKKMTPLMAASALALLGGTMSPEKIKAALQAIKDGDANKALELLEAMVAEAAGGEEPPAETPPESEAMGDAPPADDKPEDEDKGAVMAATSKLMRLTGKETLGSAVEEIETWRESHLKLEAETIRLAKERAALEANERRELVAKLVKLGAETPHTSGLGEGKICKRLADEPIAELRARVSQLSEAKGDKRPVDPPAGGGGGELTEQQRQICAEAGVKPEEFAALKKTLGR